MKMIKRLLSFEFSFPHIVALNVFVIVLCTLSLLTSLDSWWGSLANVFCIGFSLSNLLHGYGAHRMRRALDAMSQIMREMQKFNEALVQDKINIIVARVGEPDDDAPIAPRLH